MYSSIHLSPYLFNIYVSLHTQRHTNTNTVIVFRFFILTTNREEQSFSHIINILILLITKLTKIKLN